MTQRRLVRSTLFLLLALTVVPTVAAREADGDAAKAYVNDGSVYHHTGLTWLNVTNFGLIGSRYTAETDYSHAPSMRWPGENGREHLYAGGLWIGGSILGSRQVSTGQYESEIRARIAPGDTIYRATAGVAGGVRYPWTDADDDGDGIEDEDPLNGVDDDDDGAVDEDYAVIGDEYFACRMDDYTAESVMTYPDHSPLMVDIFQESFQFGDELNDDYVGLRYTIRNKNVIRIDDVYVGFFADFDIDGVEGNDLGESVNDRVGFFEYLAWPDPDTGVSVTLAYAWDSDPEALSGYAGIALLSHDACAIHFCAGQQSYANGGDPVNDGERYEMLSDFARDAQPVVGNDYRCLISAGPWPEMDPLDEIVVDFALVCGATFSEMVINAANAQLAYDGFFFDRDGDPLTGEDGKEYQVHWLRGEDHATPAMFGVLRGDIYGQSARLSLEAGGTAVENLLVRRSPRGSYSGREWRVADYEANIIDDDAVGWPRNYALVYSSGGTEIILDEMTIDLPAMRATVAASPNPFNPQVEIRWNQPEAGPMTLEIIDGRGRIVRHLLSVSQPAGEGRVAWTGDDDGGRALASGVYLVRLTTARGIASERVTLVR